MSKIYLVRHGESVANTKGIYQGQTYDTNLSKLGQKQAKMLSVFFEKINVDLIYSSPLKRTKETSRHAFSKFGYLINTEELIIETNHGQWEGLKKEIVMLRWPEEYSKWMNEPMMAKFPGGESFVQTEQRVLTWWKSAIQKKGNIVVVTHDNIIRVILASISGISLNNIWKFDLQPASVSTIEVDNIKKQRIVNIGDTSHLGNLLADLSKHAL